MLDTIAPSAKLGAKMPRILIALLLLSIGIAHAAPPDPVTAIAPGNEGGFLDDAFALSPDGHVLAYLTTDGASRGTLHLRDLDHKEDRAAPLEGFDSEDVRRLVWLDAAHVLYVEQDAQGAVREGRVFGLQAEPGAKVGHAYRVDLTPEGPQHGIVVVQRSIRDRGGSIETSLLRIPDLKVLKKGKLPLDATGRIANRQGAITLLWWMPGHLEIVGRIAGEFDPKRDLRMPDRIARVDPLSGKIISQSEIEDRVAFERAAEAQAAHDGTDRFIQFSDNRKRIELVAGVTISQLTVARPLEMYQPESLAQQRLAPDESYLSLTVDPMHPKAAARQKADPDDIDLYDVDLAAKKTTRTLTIPGHGRASRWHVGGGRLALLRKSKGFESGGVSIEIYSLPISK
jgi:hypothetical protein